MLTAVGLCTGLGISAGLYHAMNHTLFKGLLFLAAGAVLYETGTTNLDELGGLSKKMPWTTGLFLVGAFSISGLPPFNGFASKWMIYQATYEKAAETGNIGYLLVTVIALVTSVLTLASFVKVSQSVFFGRLPARFENVKDAKPGMIIAMCIFAMLCVVTGLFPSLVTRYLTEPAARAVFSVAQYIDTMMGTGYASSVMGENFPSVAVVSFSTVGYWSPVSWLLLLCIALLAITIAALSARYDCVSENKGEAVEAKYDLFFGGEESTYSQVGGGDLFWGFKHNWRHYFDFMHRLHSGVVNDYALWAAVALGLAIVFIQIVL